MGADWPKGLERLLAARGTNSIVEAVQKARAEKNPIKQERASGVLGEYEAMRNAIKEIEEEFNSINYELIDEKLVKALAEMPLKDIQDILNWKEGWFRVLRNRSWG